MVSLIIGGARSGKSRFAQSLCASSPRVCFIATARDEDIEMTARIAEHRRTRNQCWTTIEVPLHIGDAVEQHCHGFDCLLLDCLTIWLSNFCWEHRSKSEHEIETAALREIARVAGVTTQAHVVVVTNEIGCGLVPDTPLGRFFRVLQGRMNQEAARFAGGVFQVIAGIPIAIKGHEVSR